LPADGYYRDAYDVDALVGGCCDRSPPTLSVYLDVPPGETLRRALVRDEGDPADIEQRYRERYLPAQELYRAQVDPVARAHVVLDNTDPAAPVGCVRERGRRTAVRPWRSPGRWTARR
jgi:thymidylate kinase